MTPILIVSRELPAQAAKSPGTASTSAAKAQAALALRRIAGNPDRAITGDDHLGVHPDRDAVRDPVNARIDSHNRAIDRVRDPNASGADRDRARLTPHRDRRDDPVR